MLLMSAVCVWHAIVGHMSKEAADYADYVALAALIAAWVTFNAWFFLFNLCAVSIKYKLQFYFVMTYTILFKFLLL